MLTSAATLKRKLDGVLGSVSTVLHEGFASAAEAARGGIAPDAIRPIRTRQEFFENATMSALS